MSPVEELRAAAAQLRAMAADCAQGPWGYQPGPPQAEVVAEEGGWIIATSRHVEDDDDLRWIALMGPDKAAVLPAWGSHPGGIETPQIVRTVEDTAKIVDHHFGLELAFARSILGGAQ